MDAAKAVASQLIVLHHFSAYGPLADALSDVAPALADWLYAYARMAVQVFLVIAGYLAASSLAPRGRLVPAQPWHKVIDRYVRLVPPFCAALALSIACAAFSRQWLDDDFIPAAPRLAQLAAHVVLGHGVLGTEALSAGVWYVAIDFQLYALLVLLLWAGGRGARGWVAAMTLASLFLFNRTESGDNYAPYFFGAYGMGALAWWAGGSRNVFKAMAALAVAGSAALWWDWRVRIALALVVALWLGLSRWQMIHHAPAKKAIGPVATMVHALSRSSYALFLTHFSVLMLFNAAWAHWGGGGPSAVWAAWLAAFATCQALALGFERWVERPLSALRLRWSQKTRHSGRVS